MEVFHRRQISSCTKVKLKGKHRWPISFREVLLDQAWSSILTSRLFHRLELEFRGPIRTHIAVIVQTTRNSSKGDVCSSNTEWRKRCKTRGAYSNRSRLHKGQVSDPLNWVLVARNNLVTAGMQEPFNQTGSPCTSDPIVIPEVLGLEATLEWLTLPIVRIRPDCMGDSVRRMDPQLVPPQRWALSSAGMAPATNTVETRRAASQEMTPKRLRKSRGKSNWRITSNSRRCSIVWNTSTSTNWTSGTKNNSASSPNNTNSTCTSSKRWKWPRISFWQTKTRSNFQLNHPI